MFWSPAVTSGPFPKAGTVPGCPDTGTTRRAKDSCSCPRGLTQTWAFPPKMPWRKGGGGTKEGLSSRRGHTHPLFGRDTPRSKWNLGWGKEAKAGRLDTPTGIWGGGDPESLQRSF